MPVYPCIMSVNDREVLPPVLRFTRQLYVIGKLDCVYLVTDRPDNAGFTASVITTKVSMGDELCAFCRDHVDGSRRGCRDCRLLDPAVPPTYQTVGEYAAQIGVGLDDGRAASVVEEFFCDDPEYKSKQCGDAARLFLLSLREAVRVAADPAAVDYDAARGLLADRLESINKEYATRRVAMNERCRSWIGLSVERVMCNMMRGN